MVTLIDSSIWIDYLRPKTPLSVKNRVDPWVHLPETHLCEPILFELLRAVKSSQRKPLKEFFSTFPILKTPKNLWEEATLLGQKCQDKGFVSRPLDLLISQIALKYQALLLTFDKDLMKIARIVPALKVKFVDRSDLK